MTMRLFLVLAFSLIAFAAAAATPDLSKMKVWTGGDAPRLELVDLDGKKQALPDFRGKVVVINFWATWCGPCVEEMPSFERLSKNLSDERFALLTVNFGEKPDRIRPFLKKIGVNIPVLLDADMRTSKAWVKRGLPTTYIIDAEQNIRYLVLGELAWDAPAVEAKIRKLLPKR